MEDSVLTQIINHSMADDTPDGVILQAADMETLLKELQQFSFLIKEGKVELKINGLQIVVENE